MSMQGVQMCFGGFDNEEAAARAYDKAAIECCLLARLNFDDYGLPSAQQQGSSRFGGVSWDTPVRKWRAAIQVQGVKMFLMLLKTRKLQRGPTKRLQSSAACWTGCFLQVRYGPSEMYQVIRREDGQIRSKN
jgi:hypothetical protein